MEYVSEMHCCGVHFAGIILWSPFCGSIVVESILRGPLWRVHCAGFIVVGKIVAEYIVVQSIVP